MKVFKKLGLLMNKKQKAQMSVLILLMLVGADRKSVV